MKPAPGNIRIIWFLRTLAVCGILAGLIYILFGDTLARIISNVWTRESSSHGLLVPFASIYFLWRKGERIKNLKPEFSLVQGTLVIAAGLAVLHVFGHRIEIIFPALAFFLMAAGVIIAFLGTALFKELSFPFLFLMTVIPLPQPVYDMTAGWMRDISLAGSTHVMRIFGLPFYRESNIIHLPNIDLHVVLSCSGIRYLLSYVVFGLAYAFLFKKSFVSRLLVMLATVPLSMAGGIVRLSVIFLSAYYIGPFMAGHIPHILISWIVFASLLLLAFFSDQFINARMDKPKHSKGI